MVNIWLAYSAPVKVVLIKNFWIDGIIQVNRQIFFGNGLQWKLFCLHRFLPAIAQIIYQRLRAQVKDGFNHCQLIKPKWAQLIGILPKNLSLYRTMPESKRSLRKAMARWS